MKLFVLSIILAATVGLTTGCIRRDQVSSSAATNNAAPVISSIKPSPAASVDPIVAQLKAAFVAHGFNVVDVMNTSGQTWPYGAHVQLPGCRTTALFGVGDKDRTSPSLVATNSKGGVVYLTTPPTASQSATQGLCGGL